MYVSYCFGDISRKNKNLGMVFEKHLIFISNRCDEEDLFILGIGLREI